MSQIFKHLIIFASLALISSAQDIERGEKPVAIVNQGPDSSEKLEDSEDFVCCTQAPASVITVKGLGIFLNTHVIATPLVLSIVNNSSKEVAVASTVVNGTVVLATALVAAIMVKTDKHRFAKITAPIYFFGITLGHMIGLIGTWAYMDSFGQSPANEGARVLAITFNSLSAVVGLVYTINCFYNPLYFYQPDK